MLSAEEFRAQLSEMLDESTGSPLVKGDVLLSTMLRQYGQNPASADDIRIAADWAWSEKVLKFGDIESEEAHDKIFEAVESLFDGSVKQRGMGS